MHNELTEFVLAKIQKISASGDARGKECIKGIANFLVSLMTCCNDLYLPPRYLTINVP